MKPWPFPRVLAHRGGGKLAPENTIAAIAVGLVHGFRGIEFDVTLSADGEPLLMHDETLERTTDGTGPVAARTAADLDTLDAGRWFSADFAGERIPHLAQVAAYCRRHAVWMNAEIKPAPGAGTATGRRVASDLDLLCPAVGGQGAGSTVSAQPARPLLSSFSEEALAAALDAAPGLPRGLLCTRVPPDWPQRLARLQCVALHCDHRHLDAPTVEAVHRAGYWMFCYTVNDPQRAMELARWGVDAICTDQLARLGPDVMSL